MMTKGTDTTACKQCKATNVTHRHICWRCGSTLPYTIGTDGKARVNRDAAGHGISRDEIQQLLDQAQIVVMEPPKSAAHEKVVVQKHVSSPRSFLHWFAGRRSA